jgi:processive 1,2-diacylglycerol beta-glucosyltransferase
VAQTIRDLVGHTEIVHTPARTGDFSGKEVSNTRAADELAWTPSTPFTEGVRRYYEWRHDQPPAEVSPAGGDSLPAEPAAQERASRILVLTADIGEGHDLPARAVAAEICAERPGAQVAVVDGLAAVGRVLQMLIRDGSWFTFRWLPWLYEVQYFLLTRFPPTRWLSERLGYLFAARKLLRLIRAHDPDAVVSTYPGVTQILGDLRQRGRLQIPAFSVITDLAGLRFWAHPGIDLHTVINRESIEEVERIAGPGSARWARPPTSPDFLVPRSRPDARRALELPAQGQVIVVSGGGWGMGDLRGAVRAGLGIDGATVVCVTGRNEGARRRLQQAFTGEQRLRIIGFTERMSDLLAAADVLVHSTAGLTVLEAQIRGCPVISYGFGVGHVRANNKAYKRFGLAQVAGSQEELSAALERALAEHHSPDPSFASLPAPASLVLESGSRIRPLPAWRLRMRHAIATVGVALLLVSWSLATDDPYGLFARTLDIRPTTSVTTARPEVGVMIAASRQATPQLIRVLHRRGAHASFEITSTPNPRTLAALSRYGDEALPTLKAGSPLRWLKTKGELKAMAEDLGLQGHFLYAVPAKGFTFGQYALAHSAGASPVAGGADYSAGEVPSSLRRGEIIEVNAEPDAGRPAAVLDSLLADLRRSGLRALPVGVLMGGVDQR